MNDTTPEPWMHKLFAHMHQAYGLMLLEDELYQIVKIVREEDNKAAELVSEFNQNQIESFIKNQAQKNQPK